MAGYDEKDAAKDTGDSVKEVEEVWHEIRVECRNDKKHRDDPKDFARTTDWKKPR